MTERERETGTGLGLSPFSCCAASQACLSQSTAEVKSERVQCRPTSVTVHLAEELFNWHARKAFFVYKTRNPNLSLLRGKHHLCCINIYTTHSHLFVFRNDGTEFGGSIYQKVNDQLETAVNLAWTAGNSNTRFGIAAKYQIDADASFSVSSV